jgi:phospholipase C
MFGCNSKAVFLAGIILTTAACSNGSFSGSSPDVVNPAARHHAGGKIQHIVIVMQEARSFDDLFCEYTGADGKCAEKTTIPLEAKCTISDTFADFKRDVKTGDFGKEHANCPGYRRPEYAHVPPAELAPYYDIAQQYVLGHKMFSSTGNPTFEAHQYVIAALAHAENQPFGKTSSDGCVYRQFVHEVIGGKIDACFTYKTLDDELTEAGLSSNYYRTADSKHPIVSTWDAYGWIKGGSSGISPSSTFITDVASGKLAAVTWVTPAYADSDLSGSLSACGPTWVASVVNAVGESQFWSTTAVVIVWSGFGGWYDHVLPPYLDKEGLGLRVPVLVVSPYARSGYVDHVQFETTSVLRFVEDTFGLSQLAASDKRARNLATSTLDLDQQPRTFVQIKGGSGCNMR